MGKQVFLALINLIRKDGNRVGGGVVLYIRESLSYIDRNNLVLDRLEMLCAEFIRPFSKSLFVCRWYRPPHLDMNLTNVMYFFKSASLKITN